MDLSKQIIAAREQKGVTQAELARRLDMVQSNYARLEKRGDKLTMEQIQKIANALEVPLNDLLVIEQQNQDESVKGLENEIAQMKQENKRLNDLLKFYEPFASIATFMMNNPELMGQMMVMMNSRGINEATITEKLPGLKEAVNPHMGAVLKKKNGA